MSPGNRQNRMCFFNVNLLLKTTVNCGILPIQNTVSEKGEIRWIDFGVSWSFLLITHIYRSLYCLLLTSKSVFYPHIVAELFEKCHTTAFRKSWKIKILVRVTTGLYEILDCHYKICNRHFLLDLTGNCLLTFVLGKQLCGLLLLESKMIFNIYFYLKLEIQILMSFTNVCRYFSFPILDHKFEHQFRPGLNISGCRELSRHLTVYK